MAAVVERDDDASDASAAPQRRAPWAPSPATDPRNATISARVFSEGSIFCLIIA